MSEPQVFEVDGLRLTGGVSKAPTSPKAVVILCHGMPSGGPSDPDDRGYPGLADDLAAHGYDTWWFNFRGSRDSEGAFTLGGWIEDLHGVIARARDATLMTLVVGSSAGGAVALTAAAESKSIHGVATLAAPAVWSRQPNAWNETILQHSLRVGLITRAGLNESAWWAEFETNPPEFAVQLMGGRPLLIVQGTEDDIVPPLHAERLFSKAPEPKEMVMVRGAGHQLRRNAEAVEAVVRWLDAVSRPIETTS